MWGHAVLYVAPITSLLLEAFSLSYTCIYCAGYISVPNMVAAVFLRYRYLFTRPHDVITLTEVIVLVFTLGTAHLNGRYRVLELQKWEYMIFFKLSMPYHSKVILHAVIYNVQYLALPLLKFIKIYWICKFKKTVQSVWLLLLVYL
jgi:hypothetical protein